MVKTYMQHNCARQHRKYASLSRCMFPRAAYLGGEGEFVVWSRCKSSADAGSKRRGSISLHTRLESARSALARIDGSGCCGQCVRTHEIVRVVLP